MTKKIAASVLAVLILCALVACSSGKSDGTGLTDSVIDIGEQKLTYTASNGDTFTYEYLTSTTAKITAFSGEYAPHTVTIPATLGERTVTEIAASAFYACSGIAEVRFEAPVEVIGDYAFANCEGLETVEFPASVREIGKGAFWGCAALKEVILPTGATAIGDIAFYGCTALEKLTVPATLETIGDSAFTNCTALTAIELPEGVRAVGEQAFYGCTAVKSVKLPASLEEIGKWAFITQIKALTDEEIVTVPGSAAAEYVKSMR